MQETKTATEDKSVTAHKTRSVTVGASDTTHADAPRQEGCPLCIHGIDEPREVVVDGALVTNPCDCLADDDFADCVTNGDKSVYASQLGFVGGDRLYVIFRATPEGTQQVCTFELASEARNYINAFNFGSTGGEQ
jgi:hypothetical protein